MKKKLLPLFLCFSFLAGGCEVIDTGIAFLGKVQHAIHTMVSRSISVGIMGS